MSFSLPRHQTILNLLVVLRMRAMKRPSIHRHNADYIFLSFRFIQLIEGHFENSFLFDRCWGSAVIAYFVTGNEQTELNRGFYFASFCVFLLPIDLSVQDLFICLILF